VNDHHGDEAGIPRTMKREDTRMWFYDISTGTTLE
jgi:hypothetical protein